MSLILSPRALRKRIRTRLRRHADEVRRVSKEIHDYPELGYQEYRASQLLTHALARHGFQTELGIAGMATAFLARREGRNGGATVAVLAEYDALPDIGHGCGHNFIAAAALGCAIAMVPVLQEINGTLVVFGCPAEEGNVPGAGGKVRLLNAGYFAEVRSAMMIHPASCSGVGGKTSARAALRVGFLGPELYVKDSAFRGPGTVEALVLAYSGWSRISELLDGHARVHGIISEGGKTPAVIPGYTEARIYVRADTLEYLDNAVHLVRDYAEGAAKNSGCGVIVEETAHRYEPMSTHPRLAQVMASAMDYVGVEVDKRGGENMGSTDMGNVSRVVPAVHGYIKIGDVSPHTSEFGRCTLTREGQRALLLASEILALCATEEFLYYDSVMGV